MADVTAPQSERESLGVESEPTGNEGWDEWLTLFANRNEVAEMYARMLRQRGLGWGGYQHVNAAILRRWSPAGLTYIKTRAWKIATQNL